MSFRNAVLGTPDLQPFLHQGLSALRKRDRKKIRPANPQRLTGSVQLESALRPSRPNDPIWDYGVGYQATSGRADTVFWIEVHPAHDAAVGEVLRKAEWLKHWLSAAAPELARLPARLVWVSSGRTTFTPGSTFRKKLAEHGVKHTGGVLRLNTG